MKVSNERFGIDVEILNHTIILKTNIGSISTSFNYKDTYEENLKEASRVLKHLEHVLGKPCVGFDPSFFNYLRSFTSYLQHTRPVWFKEYHYLSTNNDVLKTIENNIDYYFKIFRKKKDKETRQKLLDLHILLYTYREYLATYL